jgi:uncharacterized cupin superfamily protein
VPNLRDPEFDDVRDHPGFHARRARLGRQAGAERIGVSLWEVPAGQAAYPYHYHLTEEELVIVLEGRLSLRTADGWRELEEGEVVAFGRGEKSAHQIVNRTEETVRFLAFSNTGEPDVVAYPDSGKIGPRERGPGDSGVRLTFRVSDAVDYYEDEQPPR